MLYYHFECIIPISFFYIIALYNNFLYTYNRLNYEKFQKYFCYAFELARKTFFNSIDFSFEMWIV